MMKYIDNIDVFSGNSDDMKDAILTSNKTKPITYRTVINPDLSIHESIHAETTMFRNI